MLLDGKKIGFIGGGAMAEALISGLISAGLVSPQQILVSDLSEQRRTHLADKFAVEVSNANNTVVTGADIVILAVKPFVMSEILEDTGSYFCPEHTIVSIAAGITTIYIERFLTGQLPVVRAMPNTPALLGAGATAVCCGRWAGDRHRDLALTIFGAVGRAVPVPEKLMDAVTGLSGSGPAYMYIIAEALADAGVRMGLPRDVALTLASQTMLGAARMILETGRHPGVLKDMVTTPGGTTIEGLFALEEGGIRAALYRAVEKACRRSSQQSGDNK
ncbi:pyrroline-5-carboxylate reductase [Desulfoscipio gibsoniae]|uniref:Pyrroline-5-carboxylate reductase n=1 Tax=Desulfoscipio gibsoniae DSM 7213 TaxID=767817 RepID=R4KMY9_9FIRM|nr:pyrroline-5-carboxylate reductase [Desulfoscipio gibsoniae]AGL02942.1 pyrroline-5-carboxylate reductase [Desulfoscipio gibsoniae DSM 7213]